MIQTTRDTAKLIGEQLIRKGIVSAGQLKEAIEKQRLSGHLVGEVLVELGFATEDQVTQALSEQLGIPFVDASTYEVEKAVLGLFPEEMLREHLVLPLFKVDQAVTVAMADPMNIRVTDRLRFLSHLEIEPLFASKTAVQGALDRYFGPVGSLEKVMRDIKLQDASSKPKAMAATAAPPVGFPSGPVAGMKRGGQKVTAAEALDQVTSLVAAAENAPIVKLVDTLIRQAVENRASDIHIEPEGESTFIRYRIDGILYDVPPPPKQMESAIISRIKILAGMDIAERRLPQDGRIQTRVDDKEVDLRVSSFPTIHGENMAVRVLDKRAIMLKLEDVGFQPGTLAQFNEILQRPHGILLVTGPTGCGKTTTLYAALQTINAVQKNVITLEDPVEYQIPRIRQSQVDVKAGLTFANGLRSILRQDPDIILIGEIRDLETSEIAIHAALTGHMVFATLHTNDAPGAMTRLVDMGVEPYLAASSVAGVLAQRLVRQLCAKCKEPYAATPEVLRTLKVEPGKKVTLYRAKGCDDCRLTGYRGRSGLFEFMNCSAAVRELLLKKGSSAELKEQAVRDGMVTLRQAGVAKVLKGLTTVEEVLRVTEHDIGG